MTGNTQTFKSASDMVKSLKHDNNIRKMADYKNYNAAEFKGIMTTQQRAEHAKIQRRAQAAGKIASGVAKAGATYATAIATVAAMGGGATTVQNVNDKMLKTTSRWSTSASSGAEYVASGQAVNAVKKTADTVITTAGNAKDGLVMAGGALRSGDAAKNAVSGAFRTGRAARNGAQAAAQKTVDTVTAIPKVPGKVIEGAKSTTKATSDTVVKSIDSVKRQWKNETDKAKGGPVMSGSGRNGSDRGKTDGRRAGHSSKKMSNTDKANAYTLANLNNSDDVNKSRNEEAAARAKKAVEDLKKGM